MFSFNDPRPLLKQEDEAFFFLLCKLIWFAFLADAVIYAHGFFVLFNSSHSDALRGNQGSKGSEAVIRSLQTALVLSSREGSALFARRTSMSFVFFTCVPPQGHGVLATVTVRSTAGGC